MRFPQSFYIIMFQGNLHHAVEQFKANFFTVNNSCELRIVQ